MPGLYKVHLFPSDFIAADGMLAATDIFSLPVGLEGKQISGDCSKVISMGRFVNQGLDVMST